MEFERRMKMEGTPVFDLDAIDLCLYQDHGVARAVVVAYPVHCMHQEVRAVLRADFIENSNTPDGWYNFRCELLVPNDDPIERAGSMYPPAFYYFKHLPHHIKGIRVHSAMCVMQKTADEFLPALDSESVDRSIDVTGESLHYNFFEAYLDALMKMERLPGAGRPLLRIRGVLYPGSSSTSPSTHQNWQLYLVVQRMSADSANEAQKLLTS